MHAPKDEQTIEQLTADFPRWRVWVSKDADGRPGELMATRRRRDLTDHEMRAGLALTLPMGYRGDLRAQLDDQVQRENRIGYVPGGDAL